MSKIERKYLAHYLNVPTSGSGTPNLYVRIGKDLEELNEELNPDVEVKKNILGEQSIQHSGYEVQSEVEPLYAYNDGSDDATLFNWLARIANERLTGDGCLTQKVDVLFNANGTQVWAYREDVWVVPSSIGGDTSGVQIPFTIYSAGNRASGTWSQSNKSFQPTMSGSSGSDGSGSGGSGSGGSGT